MTLLRTNFHDTAPEVLDRVRERSRALLWRCPEARGQWSRGDSAMASYAPKCTAVYEVRNAFDLEQAARALVARVSDFSRATSPRGRRWVLKEGSACVVLRATSAPRRGTGRVLLMKLGHWLLLSSLLATLAACSGSFDAGQGGVDGSVGDAGVDVVIMVYGPDATAEAMPAEDAGRVDSGRADATTQEDADGEAGPVSEDASDSGTSSDATTGADATGSDATTSSDATTGSDATTASDAATTSDSGAACVIAGTGYATGAANPTNACQSCQPTVSTSAWTDVTDGTTCGTGGICHVGACVSGCEVGGVYYATAAPNPNNPCQSCQPGKSTSAWSSVGDGTTCGNGQVCASGACGTQCDIGGVVYASGVANPSDACQTCQPGTSTTTWTGTADGITCGSGLVCKAASCVAGCFIGSTYYAANATNPSNACQSCQPGASTTAWTATSNGMTCGTGQVCNAGTCASGCSIAGTYYAATAANPSNACQTCQPATSTTAWTAAANGSGCGAGMVCNGLTCASGCFIGGAFVASGTANASNSCQSCQPGVSTTAWSNVSGATCGGGTGTCAAGSCLMPTCQTAADGVTNCGAASESCCTSLPVTGGTYNRTYENYGDGGTSMSDPATVSNFRLDKYEVTVGRFRQFVSAWNGGSGYAPPAGSGLHTHLNGGLGLNATGGGHESGWQTSYNTWVAPTDVNLVTSCATPAQATWTHSAAGNEKLPINCVNWFEAYAFCIWDGGFLSSEAEAGYVAAGGSQQREYPWGETDPGANSQYAIYACLYPSGGVNCPAGTSNIAPVGFATLGAGVWGQLDLVGDVGGWSLDWFASPFANPCTDCANVASGQQRSVRGGAFDEGEGDMLSRARFANDPTERDSLTGFRCARTP
jgi:formylglycine-generating enzyme required for sulfatase activity